MRAREFITEVDWQNFGPTQSAGAMGAYYRKIATAIKRECKPFIQNNRASLANIDYLYRGVSKAREAEFAITGGVRSDRVPRDTSREWHDTLNQFFAKQFGFQYRSAALFCTTNINEAHGYGATYIVFPKGEYRICYSPIIEDVTIDLAGGLNHRDLVSPAVNRLLDTISDDEYAAAASRFGVDGITGDRAFRQVLYDFSAGSSHSTIAGLDYEDNFKEMLVNFVLPHLGYKETLTYAEADGKEAMVRCSSYYGLRVAPVYDEHLHQVMKLILK